MGLGAFGINLLLTARFVIFLRLFGRIGVSFYTDPKTDVHSAGEKDLTASSQMLAFMSTAMLLLLAMCQAPSCCDGQSIRVTDVDAITMKNAAPLQTGDTNFRTTGNSAQGVMREDDDDDAADSEDVVSSQYVEQAPKFSHNLTGTTEGNVRVHHLHENRVVTNSSEMLRNGLNGARVLSPSALIHMNGSQSSSSVEREEEKLRNATVKLVTWLRNRLRKRLEEVATLEQEMEAEKILLENLQANITDTAAARSDEIRLKIKAQKKLTDFRRNSEEPERQLVLIQSQTTTLSDKLAHMGEVYNSLAEKHRRIRGKLHAAGFSHWLEARGKEYMPQTAVGVLSKSMELFEPLSHGIEKAAELDHSIAQGVESIMPMARDNFIVKVFEDMLMLIPIVPIFVVICKLLHTIHSISVLHIVMYVATAFCAESVLLLFVSLCLGREPLRAMQESNEALLIAGIFTNLILFIVYIFAQGLIAGLRSSRVETLQIVLGVAIGFHCYHTVFRPAMINGRITTSGASYLMYATNFCFVIYEKKRVLNVQIPYEEEINEFLLWIESWFWETVDAMRNIFYDRSQELDLYSEGTSDLCPSEFSLVDESHELQRGKQISNQWDAGGDAPRMRGRRNYEKWTGTKITTNFRNFHSNLFGIMNNAGTKGPAENTTASKCSQQDALNVSKSDCSSVYGSCKG